MLYVTLKHHSWEPEVEVFMYVGVGIEATACADSADTIYDKVNERFRLAIWNKEAKILIMKHTNDAQTVQTCQTRWVCKPRPPAYIWDPAWVQGPASISTTTSDPQPVYEARVVFKVRSVIEEIWHIPTFILLYIQQHGWLHRFGGTSTTGLKTSKLRVYRWNEAGSR